MKILDYLLKLPQIFDWYFKLDILKRIQLNYIIILTIVITIFYFNDKQHRSNYIILSNRYDAVNDNRTKEQEKYVAKLEMYADKFREVFERAMEQKEELKKIK